MSCNLFVMLVGFPLPPVFDRWREVRGVEEEEDEEEGGERVEGRGRWKKRSSPGNDLKELVAVVKRRMRRVWSACIIAGLLVLVAEVILCCILKALYGDNFLLQSVIDIVCAISIIC
mmetsp:Transcript_18845/g.39216  ORF Transcript_18845/g.39216 Transcript_18845/m.39216 type:complete len:117 (+) Transcript_18845:836-1186(+)